MWVSIVIVAVAAYLLGNLNGAVVVSHILHDDVRTHGSGNAGLTNFIRNYGAGRSALVILIDVGKAVLACVLGGLLLAPYGLALEGRTLGGVFVMLGHIFPALLGFKGGKGILSGWTIAWCVDWRIAVLIGVVFFAAYLLTQYVSLGSVLGAVGFSVGFVIFQNQNLPVMLAGVFMGSLAAFMHRANIVRLIKGEERKTNLFKKKGEKSE